MGRGGGGGGCRSWGVGRAGARKVLWCRFFCFASCRFFEESYSGVARCAFLFGLAVEAESTRETAVRTEGGGGGGWWRKEGRGERPTLV